MCVCVHTRVPTTRGFGQIKTCGTFANLSPFNSSAYTALLWVITLSQCQDWGLIVLPGVKSHELAALPPA